MLNVVLIDLQFYRMFINDTRIAFSSRGSFESNLKKQQQKNYHKKYQFAEEAETFLTNEMLISFVQRHDRNITTWHHDITTKIFPYFFVL